MPAIPSWPEILDAALTSRLRSVHTALPGTIRGYSEADQTAEVELAVQLETTLEQFARVPNLKDVPVVWPGAWSNGDRCLVIFSEEDPSKWWDSGGSVEPPAVLQRHGLHGLCIPIVALAGQAVQFVALANLVKARLDTIQAAFDAHTHVVTGTANPGGLTVAATAAATVAPIGPLADVAAAKVKAR
jgi:hypothetical protein